MSQGYYRSYHTSYHEPRSYKSKNEARRYREEEEVQNSSRGVEIQLPLFHGHHDPDAYLDWEFRVESAFDHYRLNNRSKVILATSRFSGFAKSWWSEFCRDRGRHLERPLDTWQELKKLLREKFAPSYHPKSYRRSSGFRMDYPDSPRARVMDVPRREAPLRSRHHAVA